MVDKTVFDLIKYTDIAYCQKKKLLLFIETGIGNHF